MNMRPRLLALLVPLALSACSLAPDYVRPPVEAPQAYKEDGNWKPAAGKLADPEKWWQVFGDPILDRLQEELLAQNQNLKAAEAQYRAARAAVDAARAGLFPSLGLSAAESRSSSGTTSATGTSSATSRTTNVYSLSAQASWEVDLWGRIRGGVDAAGARLEASEGTLGATRLSAQALLAQTYFQLRAAEAQAELLGRSVAAYERFLKLTQTRLSAGVVSPLDVAQAETQLNSARTQLADARLQRAQYEHAVSVLVGKAPAEMGIEPKVMEPGGALPAVPAPPALIPSTTLEARYDIFSAERQVAAANAQIGVARAAYFPVLNLTANGGFRNTVLSNLISTPARFWSLGPSLALTLFDAGARSAAVEQARASYDQAVANYRQTVLTAFQEVEDNLVATRLLAEESTSQAAALAAARRARQIAENQYRAGIVASLNVITAQTSELNVENTTIAIWNRRMAAAVQLYKNAGGRPVAAQ